MLICCAFMVSLSFAQISDEEGLRLRRQLKPKRNIVQEIVAVPTAIVRLPFFLIGKGSKITAIFIDDIALIPRTKAFLTSDDGLIAFYPTVSVGGRAGLGGELNFFNKRSLKPGNKLSLQAAYTTNGHQNHFIMYQIPELAGLLSLDMDFGYNVNTNEDFFGIGNETDYGNRMNFRHEKLGGGLAVGIGLTEWLRTGIHADYTDHNLKNGEDTASNSILKTFDKQTADPEPIPGLDGAALLGVGGFIALDSRDNDFYPSRGNLAKFSATMFNQTDDSKYGFMRYTLELSNYLTLFRRGRIFAVRLFAEVNTRLSDTKKTPFFERADMGGATNVRGYSIGRFRDKDMIVLNLEYRYPVWDAARDTRGGVDAVIFWDVGRVFNDLATDTFKDYKNSFGGGIRARTIDGFLFRAEVSRSDEEINVIFKFEPMF